MSRCATRAAGFVRPASDRQGERRALTVQVIQPEFVMVDLSLVTQLGFSQDQARNAKREFAARLRELSLHLAGQPARDVVAVPHPATPTDDPLRLDPDTGEEYLDGLRELGAGLRGLLSRDMAEKLKGRGFPADGPEEPALTFTEAQAPILWEMMYEGTRAGPLDWRRFWGFRVPITHWMIGQPATAEEIEVGNGLFAAVSEDLYATSREVSALATQLGRRCADLRHGSLADALRTLARAELPGYEVDEVEWLLRVLASKSRVERKRWKEQALVSVFRDARSSYGLIHFACHCAASDATELLSCLLLRVGGEPLSLDVGLMAADLQQERGPHPSPNGPLVFLNACGTGQQNPSAEPPGFPAVWVGYGAMAVIATLCPVPDHFAHAFAVKFYEFLFRATDDPTAVRYRFLAEALLATRRYFMEEYNNPLGLAYVLYARKGVRVLIDPTRAEEPIGGGLTPAGKAGFLGGGEGETRAEAVTSWIRSLPPQPPSPPPPFLPAGIAGRARPPAEAGTDPVDCTAFAPPEAAAGDTILVQVFAHMPEQAAEAKQLAQEFDEEARRLGFRSLEVELARGERLLIQLALPGLEVDDPVQHLTWRGRPASVQFAVSVPPGRPAGNVVGTVTAFLDTVPVGHVKFKLKVSAGRPAQAAAPRPLGDEARRYEHAFISYASKDRDEVLKRVQMLNRCHIDFFQDVLVLEPGDRWERKLYEHIDRCDVFLLFWSTAAKESEWVEKEVRYALARKAADEQTPPEIVPVLIEGPPVPLPPPYLSHLHFNDRLLYFLSRRADAT